jgi:hypothetical protein
LFLQIVAGDDKVLRNTWKILKQSLATSMIEHPVPDGTKLAVTSGMLRCSFSDTLMSYKSLKYLDSKDRTVC